MPLLIHLPAVLLRSFLLLARMLWLVPFSFFKARRRKKADGFTLFFYSQVVWDEVWQRPQEFALRAARRRPVVFFCPVQIHRLYDSLRRWRRVQHFNDGGARLTVVTPLIFPGEYKSRLVRLVNRVLVRAEVQRLVGDGTGAVLLTNSPFAEPLRHAFRWRAAVYDVIDDYAAFDWAPPESLPWHDALVAHCDAIITGTHSLLEQIRPRRPDAEYVASGVDFDLFYRAAPPPSADTIPPELRGLRGVIAGYTGSISDRLDAEILRLAAARYPAVQFVLIGPVHGSFGPPPRAPNLHYLGLKPHSALPAYLRRFDLALLPFRLTQAALATNPVKTLEYLAAGCVVLSTAIPDVERFYGDVVVVARSREEFVEKIGELLAADNRERRARGVERARGASWDAMARRIERRIEEIVELCASPLTPAT